MRTPILLAAALCAAAPAAAQRRVATDVVPPNVLSSEEMAQGFRLLFDGTTTNGWRGYRRATMHDGWRVVDGALTRVGPGGDIVTAQQYADFELRLQWKVAPRGNSGIMFRVSEDYEESYTSGPEMQVLDDAGHGDGTSRLTAAGSNYAIHAVSAGIVRPAGQWNDVRLIVRGAHVEHWLNGTKVVEYELWSDDWRRLVQASKFVQWPQYGMSRRGHIALQDHGDTVAYRSIRLREFP
jgi:hypothetical protein